MFQAPADTGYFPISTITNAVLTTSFPTVAVIISSVLESISTQSVLTTTTTEYSSLVNVTSTGSILIPIGNVPSPLLSPPLPSPLPFPFEQIPLGITVFPIASFKKWKRVAESTSIPLGAVTISGTRGITSATTPITSPGTTISATTTSATTTTTPQSTVTPPPVTVTVSPSVVTLPPTIITVTPTGSRNATLFASPVVSTVSPLFPVTTLVTTTTRSPGINTSVGIETVLATECAICTSGLINSGNRVVVSEWFGWAVWIGIVTIAIVRY